MNFKERDIFVRLRQSYLLQIGLIKKYPWIFEFDKLSVTTNSEEINKVFESRANRNERYGCQIFDMMDVSRFRDGLDIEKAKQFILWANIGFTSQILNEIRDSQISTLDYENIIVILDEYFDELRKVFYSPDKE